MADTVRITLPCGHLTPDGKVIREAEIRELTGKTQTLFGRRDIRKNPIEIYRHILKDCLASYGGQDFVSEAVLRDMLLGDQHAILVEIRKLSMGPDITLSTTCANKDCGTKLHAPVNLDDIDVWELPDPDDTDASETYTIEEVRMDFDPKSVPRLARVFSASDDGLGVAIKARFPTVQDANSAAEEKGNDAIASHAVLGRVLVEWSDHSGSVDGPVGPDFFLTRSWKAIDWFNSALAIMSPGPEMTKTVVCEECGFENPTRIESSDFFGSNLGKETPSKLTRRSGKSV